MPKYKYTVKAPDGRSIQGFMDARNEGDVIEELKKKSLMIISVERARKAPIKQTRKKVKSDELVDLIHDPSGVNHFLQYAKLNPEGLFLKDPFCRNRG